MTIIPGSWIPTEPHSFYSENLAVISVHVHSTTGVVRRIYYSTISDHAVAWYWPRGSSEGATGLADETGYRSHKFAILNSPRAQA